MTPSLTLAIREGMQFYTDFHALLGKLKMKADDYVLARQTEKEDVLSDMRRVAASPQPPPSATYVTGLPPQYAPSAPVASFPSNAAPLYGGSFHRPALAASH